jgi:hypothetical protein
MLLLSFTAFDDADDDNDGNNNDGSNNVGPHLNFFLSAFFFFFGCLFKVRLNNLFGV